MDMLLIFLLSLGLTIAVESSVCWVIGVRDGRHQLVVLLVNVLTNPAAVLTYYLISFAFAIDNRFIVQLPIEIVVIIVETMVYYDYKKSGWNFKRPLLISVMANGISYGLGLLLNYFIF